ncbi:hypothetical protein LIER_30217 [Lithospermum erythrorhizon]|uniref:Uncharacterized protein n=1 Tax=Lithospermum erythrorhizon TaxID=34254 RepID=A0AAV3RQK1_LITER
MEEPKPPKATQPSHPKKEEEAMAKDHGTMNPKAYDLLVKAGYDPTKDATVGKATPEFKKSGLNETQKKLQRRGYTIKSSTAGLGYSSNSVLEVGGNSNKD